MRITFIRPHLTDRRSADAMEPLVFAILAGLTPPDVKLSLHDERLAPIPDNHETDLVALTVETYTARRAYQIASDFRKRGIRVVMGGYHPSFLPEEALTYADSVVIGDGEGVWEQLVRDAQRGRLQRVYRHPQQLSLDGLAFDRSIFEGKRYKPIVPVQFGRGCRFACDFCSIHAFYGSHTRQRPVAEVVAEIEALGRRYILFIDDNLFVDIHSAEELFQALVPLNIRWACQISIDIAKDIRLLDLMAKSGCFAALIGFESLNEDNLRQMKKGWNVKHGDYDTTIRRFRERGIMIYASLVFGYDYDTVDTFDLTAEFAIRSKCALANINILAPMPGAGLLNRLRDQDRLIFDRWWLDPNYRYGQSAFHPLQMSADELVEGCMRARKLFHGYRSILRRAVDPVANSHGLHNMVFYWGANLIARRELSYKVGHRLGADTLLEPALENVPVQLPPKEGLRRATAKGG